MKYQQDIGEWNESEWEGQGQYAIPIPSITKEDRVARDTTVRNTPWRQKVKLEGWPGTGGRPSDPKSYR